MSSAPRAGGGGKFVSLEGWKAGRDRILRRYRPVACPATTGVEACIASVFAVFG